jgi:hypothetical protein
MGRSPPIMLTERAGKIRCNQVVKWSAISHLQRNVTRNAPTAVGILIEHLNRNDCRALASRSLMGKVTLAKLSRLRT